MISLTPVENQFHCSVTFTLPEHPRIQRAGLVGDFEDAPWDPEGFRMRRDGDGRWRVTLRLEPGQAYEFRYLINGSTWLNDDQCPIAVNSFGIAYSVLRIKAFDLKPIMSEQSVISGLVLIRDNPVLDKLLRMNTAQPMHETRMITKAE